MKLKPIYKDNKKAFVKNEQNYLDLYKESIQNPDTFWSKVAKRISWFKKWNTVSKIDYSKAHIEWFKEAELNACYNCLDRHIEDENGNDIALIWEGNNPQEDKKLTYQELLDEVSKFANLYMFSGLS